MCLPLSYSLALGRLPLPGSSVLEHLPLSWIPKLGPCFVVESLAMEHAFAV